MKKWIKCSDELPLIDQKTNKSQNVLLIAFGEIRIGYAEKDYFMGKERITFYSPTWWVDTRSEKKTCYGTQMFNLKKIVHYWMPLPKLPELEQ